MRPCGAAHARRGTADQKDASTDIAWELRASRG